MLSAADASLVERDPRIPALGLLLDPDAFTELLARLYGRAGVTRTRAVYVRYKPGTSCLVSYRVTAAAGEIDVYARAHAEGTTAKLVKAAARPSRPGPLGSGIAVVPESALLIYPFPNDHELALDAIDDPATRRALLPGHPELWDAPAETLRYKPERRYVARLRGALTGGAVLKLYARADYRAVRDNPGRLEAMAPLRLPACLGRSAEARATALEWLDGTLLLHEIAAGRTAGCGTAGAALAMLHGQKAKKLRVRHTAERSAQALADAATAVEEVAPGLGARAGALARTIGEKLVARHWRARRTIHGDFSADQVLLDGDVAAIIDLDRAGYGDPRIDLATFRAKLVCDEMRGALPAAVADAAWDELVAGYRAAADKDVTRRLDRFVAASLLLITIEPFRHRAQDWPGRMAAILARAEQLAGGGDRGADA